MSLTFFYLNTDWLFFFSRCPEQSDLIFILLCILIVVSRSSWKVQMQRIFHSFCRRNIWSVPFYPPCFFLLFITVCIHAYQIRREEEGSAGHLLWLKLQKFWVTLAANVYRQTERGYCSEVWLLSQYDIREEFPAASVLKRTILGA